MKDDFLKKKKPFKAVVLLMATLLTFSFLSTIVQPSKKYEKNRSEINEKKGYNK